jgi:hypothetical protein
MKAPVGESATRELDYGGLDVFWIEGALTDDPPPSALIGLWTF